MSKHTPGQWHQVGAWVEVANESIPDICTCNPADIGQDHLDWDWETVTANARLIAAAPDLLKWATKLTKALRDESNAFELALALDELENAINRAKKGWA
jgi:hypothetical protein